MELSVLDRQKALLMQRLYQNPEMIIDHYGNSIHRYPLFDPPSSSNCNNNDSSATTTARVEMSKTNGGGGGGSCSIKKRKAEYDVEKVEEEEEEEEEADESQSHSAITTKNNNNNGKDVNNQQKPDYIHVRARRGQATDSHSLAERARREKISKKMKCLQDLVPGCNRATGKAGMLDEIINYVQSLQKQVEFLSMKLAVLNPRLDVSIDDFFAKEIPAYIASLPAATPYDSMDPTSFAHSSIGSNHGFDIVMNQALNKASSSSSSSSLAASMQIPEMFLDPSFIHQLQQMSGMEAEFPNILYNMGPH